jgi:eukaryotic-like serine/threonine-protein kinase
VPSPLPPLPAGHMINNRYKLRSHLGRGAAGDVYEVFDQHMGAVVALKLLNPVGGQPAAWDEARVHEQLRGDYLLPVYNADVVEGSDIRFITTRVMDGGDLDAEAAEYGVDVAVAVRWACQLSHAAERLHSAAMIHRDIKPGNAFLDSDRNAHLADLGKAVALDSIGRASPDGSPVTVAPEAVGRSNPPWCGVQSDVYSLGATAFYLLAGEYPVTYKGVSMRDYLSRVANGDRQRLRDLAPQVTQGLATVVERALSPEPADRQGSALEFANQLSTARRYPRPWRRIAPHTGHLKCLEAGASATKKGVRICVIGDPLNKVDIDSRYASGRSVPGATKANISVRDVSKELRRLCSDL